MLPQSRRAGIPVEGYRTGTIHCSGIFPDGAAKVGHRRLGGVRPHAGDAIETFFVDRFNLIGAKCTVKDRHLVDLSVKIIIDIAPRSDGKICGSIIDTAAVR